MINVKLFIETALEIWGMASIASFVAYKRHSYGAVRWEDGFYVLGMRIISLVSKIIPPLKKKVNIWWADNTIRYERVPDSREVLEIVKRLDGHPYETPSLFKYDVDIVKDSVIRVDIHAVDLVSKYNTANYSTIHDIAHNVIQNYYMETRNMQVDVDISIATPQRLYFEIPLSNRGRKILEQNHTPLSEQSTQENSDFMEAEINLFEDSSGDIQ